MGIWSLGFGVAHAQTGNAPPISNRVTVEVVGESNFVGSIPKGSQRVSMITLRFTARCTSDVQVYSVTLTHRGLGTVSDIRSVYGVSDGVRVSRGRTIDGNSGRVGIPFRSFVIPACEVKSVTFYADFSADAALAGEHLLTLEDESDVDASHSVVYERPGFHRIRHRLIYERPPIRRIVEGSVGTIGVEYPDMHRSVTYGYDRIISRILLKADSLSDHLINSITFTNEGSAKDADLVNLFLETRRGERVSLVRSKMNGSIVEFILDPPMLLERNEEKILQLRADVFASRRKTIRFLVEEPGDIQATIHRRR